jgi:hypothetical protein
VAVAEALARGGRYHPGLEGFMKVSEVPDAAQARARGEGPA